MPVLGEEMKVNSITIVGGGTSGWLTAAYLHYNHPDISITVVDKEIGNSIGVGEATLLNFKPFMDECGFSVDEWFTELDAGYKSGIMFSNWKEPGNDIWHPFYKGHRHLSKSLKLWDVWSLVQEYDFKKYALGSYNDTVLHNSVNIDSIGANGYHIDCGKLVLYIQKKLKDKINIIRSGVVNVNKDGDTIINLTLKNEEVITADLFVDCTGFLQLLGTPKERVNLDDRLFVNTAVVCQIPYEDRPTEFKPYAICDAVDHGWIWKIGVSTRIGSGMVFNRNITSIDEAKEYFVNYWNNRIPVEKVRAINWDPYYVKDQWRGNVVNIGLSAGFIEPLESTGVGLITVGVTQLSNAIRDRMYSNLDQRNFNTQMEIIFDDAVDFISAHYANNLRSTPFWKHVEETFVPSKMMLHHVEQLNNPDIQVPYDGKINYFFNGCNWTLLLQQLGYSVAERNINLSKDQAIEILVKNYISNEKHKHIWCRPHSLEVDRLTELKNLNG
jgi:tryptophan halogenase